MSDCEAEFRDLLRGHRLAANLTQAAVADRAGLSLRGVSDLERGSRKSPYRETVLRLASALDLDDTQTAALLAAVAHHASDRAANRGDPVVLRNNLPCQLTSFVGRDTALAELARLLASGRLLTLVGPGGVGKTFGAAAG